MKTLVTLLAVAFLTAIIWLAIHGLWPVVAGVGVLAAIHIIAICKVAARKMPTPAGWTTEDRKKRREILCGSALVLLLSATIAHGQPTNQSVAIGGPANIIAISHHLAGTNYGWPLGVPDLRAELSTSIETNAFAFGEAIAFIPATYIYGDQRPTYYPKTREFSYCANVISNYVLTLTFRSQTNRIVIDSRKLGTIEAKVVETVTLATNRAEVRTFTPEKP